MPTPPDHPEQDPDAQLPTGPGSRIISRITIILMVLLAVLIWADTPNSVPGDRRFFARLFLKFVITIVVGGGLFLWWRKRRRAN